MTEDVQRTLGRLEGKVDILLERNTDFSERIAHLETDNASSKTTLGIISAITSVAVTALLSVIGYFFPIR